MKYGRKLLLLPVALIVLVGFFAASLAFAQTPTPANFDVTVSPVFFDLTANPGDTVNAKVRIRNNTTSPLPLKITVEQMTGDANGNLTLKSTANDNSLSWVHFTNGNTIVANPLEWTDVPFTITIPKTAAYGYYYAISFAQDNNSPLRRTGAAITGAAAVPILLDVKKAGAKADATITNFSTSQQVYEYLPVDFNVTVANSGNIQVQPHGNIFISNGANNNIATLDVNPNAGNIIPGTKRVFTPSWSDGFLVQVPVMEGGKPKLDQNGKPVYQLQINWNKLTNFRVGKYTANLILVFDNGTRDVSLEKTISFWVIPYKAIAVMLVIILVVIAGGWLLIKSYINREVAKRTKD